MSPQIYAYLRISTDKQNIDVNRSELILKVHELGLNTQNLIFIEDIKSGLSSWKTGKLNDIVPKLNKGDVFITSEVSRIGRTISQIFEFISILLEKEVKIYFTKSNFPIDGSINSQMLIFAMSITAQLERELIASRTRSAMQKLKAEGKKLGRPEGHMILDPHLLDIKKLIKDGVKLGAICKKYNVSNVTMSKFIKKRALKTKIS